MPELTSLLVDYNKIMDMPQLPKGIRARRREIKVELLNISKLITAILSLKLRRKLFRNHLEKLPSFYLGSNLLAAFTSRLLGRHRCKKKTTWSLKNWTVKDEKTMQSKKTWKRTNSQKVTYQKLLISLWKQWKGQFLNHKS